MRRTYAGEKLDWAVAVHRRDAVLELELAHAVFRCLHQLGHSVRIVHDGQPEGLQVRSLLLLTNYSNFPGFSAQLRQAGKGRPRVLVWQMDPLPPDGMQAAAAAWTEKAAAWRARFGLSASPAVPSRWYRFITARRLRGRLYRLLSGFGYRVACRLLNRTGGVAVAPDWTQLRGTAEAWIDLRQGLLEGAIDRLAVSTRQRQRFLANRGINAPFIPVGACPELGTRMDLTRDLDVLFVGRVKHGPRAAKLTRISRDLAAAGIQLHPITADCYGTERARWLNRTRLVLNLHNYPWSPAWIRFVMATLCGAVVVSEPTADQEPFAAGLHYVAAPPDQLAATIRHLLNDPARCADLQSAATALCRDSLTMLDSVAQLCSLSAANHV